MRCRLPLESGLHGRKLHVRHVRHQSDMQVDGQQARPRVQCRALGDDDDDDWRDDAVQLPGFWRRR